MVTQAKRNANVRMQLRRLNYAEADIPDWFKKPTAEQQVAFDAALVAGPPTPEQESTAEQAGAGGAGVNIRNTPLQGQGFQGRLPAGLAMPPGMGAPAISAEQQLLSGTGISFFNNSWSKVTPLPQGGYSVVPVDGGK